MDRLANHPEILDAALPDVRLLRQSLHDLRQVNRWLGGAALSRSALAHLTQMRAGPRRHEGTQGTRRGVGAATPLRLLDVGTGLGDIPSALLQWAAQQGIRLEIEAIDSRAETVDVARGMYGDAPGLRLRVADARSLPYSDGAFDVAHTSLMAHHLEPAELLTCLGELRRVSRLGVIVNDLDRNPVALVGAWLLSHLFTTSPITRHDAPLSVRRAYRPSELARIAGEAGLLEIARVRGVLGYRYALAFVPGEDPPAPVQRINGRA